MKYTLFIFGLYLVAVSAGASDKPGVDYKAKVENIRKEVTKITKDAAANLRKQVEEIYLDRLKQVEAAVSDIDDLREVHEMCVGAEDENVNATKKAMHKSLAVCGAITVNSSAAIVVEISNPAKQLLLGGYDLLRSYRKCKRHRYPLLCYSRLTIKATLYMENARESTKAIKQTVNDDVSKVQKESDDCAKTAVDVALQELAKIRASIDACIAKE